MPRTWPRKRAMRRKMHDPELRQLAGLAQALDQGFGGARAEIDLARSRAWIGCHRAQLVRGLRYPDRVCIYFDGKLIARHPRRYGRHEDIEDPDHAKALIAQRHRAREQRLMLRFLALSPDAQAYYDGLEQRRLNARNHLRKILALAEVYPADQVARAISDGLACRP